MRGGYVVAEATCPKCGRAILRAQVYESHPRFEQVTLDAEPTPDGSWSAWLAPKAPGMPGAGVHMARLAPNDNGWQGAKRCVHACAGRVGEQMELSA